MNKGKCRLPMHIVFSFGMVLVLLLTAGSAWCAKGTLPVTGEETAERGPTGSVSGKFVTEDGGSMAGGQVLFYKAGDAPPPKATRYLRVPSPDLTGEILPDGTFAAELPEGSYYFGAIKRNSGELYGMPSRGDYYFRHYKEGSRELQQISIQAGEHLRFGTLKALRWQGPDQVLSARTAIEGTLTYIDGSPVDNGLVFAFSTARMIGQLPLFVSDRTGKDGKFILKVAGDATYYLMARDIMGGGQVQEGGIIGFYGGRQPVGITVKDGAVVKNIYITVAQMGHRGPEITPGEEKGIDFNNIGSKKPDMLPEKTNPGVEKNR